MMRWGCRHRLALAGLPSLNHRNTSSPYWRGCLKPDNRCLMPFNSFAEYAPEPNPETKKKDVVGFAINEDRPLLSFAGIWTVFKGVGGTKSKPIPGPHLVYGFLTTSANAVDRAHPPESHVGHFDDGGSARRRYARAAGRGPSLEAAIAR